MAPQQLMYQIQVKHNMWGFFFQKGYCPDLEFLEINTKLNSKNCELPICIQALQVACPKLKVKNVCLSSRPICHCNL